MKRSVHLSSSSARLLVQRLRSRHADARLLRISKVLRARLLTCAEASTPFALTWIHRPTLVIVPELWVGVVDHGVWWRCGGIAGLSSFSTVVCGRPGGAVWVLVRLGVGGGE